MYYQSVNPKTNIHYFNVSKISLPQQISIKQDLRIYNRLKLHITKPSLGLLLSVFKVLRDFIDNTKEEHLLIFEDDVYSHKETLDNMYINENTLKNRDVVYLGCHIYNSNIYNIKNNIDAFINIQKINTLIYGNYSIILSRKIANIILNIGIENVVKLNLSWDLLLNFIRFNYIDNDNAINWHLYFKQLFIPEVNKYGINGKRDDSFYEFRSIDRTQYAT